MNEYGVSHTLETPRGNLTFNPASGDGYYIGPRYRATPEDRQPHSNAAQRDGAVMHRGFRGATFITIPGVIVAEAGLSTRLTMMQNLRGYLESLRRADGRLRFTPSGYGDQRLWDDVRLHQFPEISGGFFLSPKDFEFTIKCPYPYAIDFTQTTTALSGSHVVTNNGNSNFFPVLKVYGGTFTVTNITTNQQFVMTGATGFASYIELDFFRMTAYADGDQANMLRYWDITAANSAFWYLQPGANTIQITGATADMLWNHAWA
jgi:hypothetical protein